MNTDRLVIVRGGGDIATGTIQKLWRAGFQTVVLETVRPSAIRRNVALCEAVYEGEWTVEDVTAVCVKGLDEAMAEIAAGRVPLMIDPDCAVLQEVHPLALVDAILAKRNLGTKKNMAGITIGLGPGFTAGEDVDAVVETMRGHNLGRLILSGTALPNTGMPGMIAGIGKERVIHAPAAGCMHNIRSIGDTVQKGEVIARIGDTQVKASLDGIIRGLIRNGYFVEEGLKIADIDPRVSEKANCFTISDKARCIGGSVLEAVMMLARRQQDPGSGAAAAYNIKTGYEDVE